MVDENIYKYVGSWMNILYMRSDRFTNRSYKK